MTVKAYLTKVEKIKGTKYSEVSKKALKIYSTIQKRSKRKPYIRSSYFKKDKVFLSLFWVHIRDKFSVKDKIRRLKYFPCAIELIRHNCYRPTSKEDVHKKSIILHRFTGITPSKEIFFVQVKENKRTGQKNLISVFPFDS